MNRSSFGFLSTLIFHAFLLCGCGGGGGGGSSNAPKAYTLTVTLDPGIYGSPPAGANGALEGTKIDYLFFIESGYSELAVTLDGAVVPESGSLVMDGDHTLVATCQCRLTWYIQLDKAVYYSVPAMGDDGTIYFGTGIWNFSTFGSLYAASPDGKIQWSRDLEYNAYTPVIGKDGSIFIQDFKNKLYAFAPDGTPLWTYDDYDNNIIWYDMGQRNPAVGSDGTVYVPADGVYAVDPSSGTRIWRFNPYNKQCRQSPVVGEDGTIYIFIHQDQFFAVNPNGTQKWEAHLDHDYEMTFGCPAIDDDGVLYVGSETHEGGGIYAFDPQGTKKWKYVVEGPRIVRSSPAIGPDGTIYVGTQSGPDGTSLLLALDPSGNKKWAYQLEHLHVTGDDLYSSPSVGADGMIYFGAETGFFYALRPDGTLAWKTDPQTAFNWGSAAIVSDGTAYIGGISGPNYAGRLCALRTSSLGYAQTPWPRFRHENRNSGTFGAP